MGHTKGQILGGRWKPVHYMLAQHLYRDAVIICGDAGKCLLKNDNALAGFKGTWATALLKLGATAGAAPMQLGGGAVDLPRGSGAAACVCADGGAPPCKAWSAVLAASGCASDGSDCVLRAELADAAGAAADAHVDLLAPPVQLALPRAAVDAAVDAAPAADGSVGVTMSANATALLVMLTTGEQGVWSDNVLTLAPGAPQKLVLKPIAGAAPIDAKALPRTCASSTSHFFCSCVVLATCKRTGVRSGNGCVRTHCICTR